jgi:hypothetical protein
MGRGGRIRRRGTGAVEHQSGLAQEQFEDFPLEACIAKRHANKMPLVDNLRLLRAPAGGEQG